MNETTRALLRTIASACAEVGSSNDLQDRGDPAGAQAMRDRARELIAASLKASSPDDRERIACLFGADPLREFGQVTWVTSADYIQVLLERDSELPLEALRHRQAHFLERIEDLRGAPAALEGRLRVRYTRTFSPSMLTVFLALVERDGDPAGSYWSGATNYRLNLRGEGLRNELRAQGPAPDEVLVDGVLIEAAFDRVSAFTGVVVRLRSRDEAALARTKSALLALLLAEGWVQSPA